MSTAIVTDSAADIPADLLKKNNITEVPVIVNFGDESFKENVDLSADDFYERLQNSKEFPTTSQPAVGDFIDVYTNLAKKHDSIISIHISSKLSGTFNAAEQAAKEVGNSKCNITVVDTLSVSMGTGLIALEVAKSVKSGMKSADAVNYANELSEKGKIFVAVSTLEYLKKGGRIKGAAALIGGFLNVKPILTNVDGLVENWAKPRTMLRALSQIRDAAEGYVNIQNMAVLHTTQGFDARALASSLADHKYDGEILRSQFGPALGAHLGPGAVGVMFIGDVPSEEEEDEEEEE